MFIKKRLVDGETSATFLRISFKTVQETST